MKLFGLIDQDKLQGASTDGPQESTLISETGTPQGLISRILMERSEIDLDIEILKKQYQERMDEIFGIIKLRMTDLEEKIKVDTVTVKLGVDAGGKIGWFVEGRVDISLAFEVKFKISE